MRNIPSLSIIIPYVSDGTQVDNLVIAYISFH